MIAQNVHGGDIYRNQVAMDFSVNVNPLGMPDGVKAAMQKALEECSRYPDMEAERLKRAVSGQLALPEEDLLFGNGASELFMAIAHGIKPRKTVIPIPSFYGYEYVAKAAGSEIIYYEMKQENHFCTTEEFYDKLTEDVELLFLANPNNPTGVLTKKEVVMDIVRYCKAKGIYVVLDECFIEFGGEENSMLSEAERFDNLLLVRTFTKIFAIPGVRLGYLICSNQLLLKKIAAQIPEWNLSCFAQEAGCACVGQEAFVRRTREYVRQERLMMEERLWRLGFHVFPSAANFILFYREENADEEFLYAWLLARGILIRDCGNFRGLSEGFYRIAVKSREENEKLLQTLAKI